MLIILHGLSRTGNGQMMMVKIGKSYSWFLISFCYAWVSEEFYEVLRTLRITKSTSTWPTIVNHGNKIITTIEDQKGQPRIFKENKVAYADPNLFTFFTISLVYGQPDQALNGTNFVILSQSIAEKYFGKKDPAGELLMLSQ